MLLPIGQFGWLQSHHSKLNQNPRWRGSHVLHGTLGIQESRCPSGPTTQSAKVASIYAPTETHMAPNRAVCIQTQAPWTNTVSFDHILMSRSTIHLPTMPS